MDDSTEVPTNATTPGAPNLSLAYSNRERNPPRMRSQSTMQAIENVAGGIPPYWVSIRGESGVLPAAWALPNTPVLTCITPPPCLTPQPGSPLEQFDVIAGWDSEWERVVPVSTKNRAAAYQWTALHQYIPGSWLLCEGIHYVENDKRLTAAQYLGKVFHSLGIGYKAAKDKRVLLLGHYTLADLSLFADRTTFNQRFQEIRGTLVTLRGHVNVKASFESRHAAEIRLTLRDTMLLAPQKQASLEAIGQYTQHKKLVIAQYWKEHMCEYLKTDPEGFAAYAINDCRVALEYYINVVDALVEVTGVRKIPLTIGGAALAGFSHWLGGRYSPAFLAIFGKEEQEYSNTKGHTVTVWGKCPLRQNSERIAGESYMGGLNTAYESSSIDTTALETLADRSIILDIDFVSAYPTALAPVPAVDWTRKPVDLNHVRQLQERFNPEALRKLGYVPNILGYVEFEFPEDVVYPCLPMRYANGLIYPLRGQTYCTGLEMDAAVRLGARLELKEVKYFPILRHEDGRPVLPFARYLARLIAERKKATSTLYNMLYKEMANSLYGKGAQGIEERTRLNHYDNEDGSTNRKRLPESEITVPHFAALCTGTVRAALSMVVVRLAECPGFRVLSATTDGCMLVAPKRFDPDLLPVKDGHIDAERVDLLSLYPEIRALEQSPAIVALLLGREQLAQAGPWAVIKHIGDQALTLRTRVNSLSYKGVEQHVAHTGIDTAETGLAELHRELGLVIQHGKRLPSAREITTGMVDDFVEIDYEHTANADYDYKRHLLPNGSTRPFATKRAFSEHREAVYRLRKKEHVRAVPERVDAKVAASQGGMHAQKGETQADLFRRYVHKAIAHGIGEWHVYAKGAEIAGLLGIGYKTQYQSYRRRAFEPQRFPPCDLLYQVACEEALKIGKALTPAMYRALTMQ